MNSDRDMATDLPMSKSKAECRKRQISKIKSKYGNLQFSA